MKFELWKSDIDKEWYWHLRGKNGKVIASSEGYKRKADAIKTVALIKSNVATAPLEEL